MAKILLSDVKSGSLISEIREETVEFWHKGELCEVDFLFKNLPFIETESLYRRMQDKEDVAAEWISKALVDEDGKQQFTKQQVEKNFIQPLANVIFEKLWGLDNVKKATEKATTKIKKE